MKLMPGKPERLRIREKYDDGRDRGLPAEVAVAWSVDPPDLASVSDGRVAAAAEAAGRSGTLRAVVTTPDGGVTELSTPLEVLQPARVEVPAAPPRPTGYYIDDPD